MRTPDDPNAKPSSGHSSKPSPATKASPSVAVSSKNVVDLTTTAKRKKAKSRVLKNKSKGTTLCSSGFHKWKIDQKKQFDVKAGKLITIKRCSRCGQTKTLAT